MTNPSQPTLPPELRNEPDSAELASVWDRLPEPVITRTAGDTDAAWDSIRDRIAGRADAGPAHRSGTVSPRRPWFGTLLRVAAVAVLALGGTAAWYSVPVTHSADAGERREVSLPDGSRVTLNAGSTVRYRRGFSWLPGLQATRRAVRLDGEAFFDVTPAVRPFTVDAGAARIRVLGTRFNVRARGETAVARVDVEEGRVEVADPLRAYTLILRAGEAARVDAASGDFSRAAVDERRVAVWRSGGIAMTDERLADIVDELALRFDTGIRILDDAARDVRLSVYYADVRSLESVLSDLATQQDLRYRQTSDGWELF